MHSHYKYVLWCKASPSGGFWLKKDILLTAQWQISWEKGAFYFCCPPLFNRYLDVLVFGVMNENFLLPT